jgi:hypothetical protein
MFSPLSSSRLADDVNELALVDVEIDAVEYRLVSPWIDFDEFFYLEKSRIHAGHSA